MSGQPTIRVPATRLVPRQHPGRIAAEAIPLVRPDGTPTVPSTAGDRLAFHPVPPPELERLARREDGGAERVAP